jgi:hypothetical protein
MRVISWLAANLLASQEVSKQHEQNSDIQKEKKSVTIRSLPL